ncbi:MAG: hypothetical protein AB1705_02195 [Verrucomicrobiota bacterium]
MSVHPDLQFRMRGFSPRRMAYMLCMVALGFIPVHARVSCAESVGITGFAFVNVFVAFALCAFAPRAVPDRFAPGKLAFVVFAVHTLLTH